MRPLFPERRGNAFGFSAHRVLKRGPLLTAQGRQEALLQNKTKQNKTKQNKTKQNKTGLLFSFWSPRGTNSPPGHFFFGSHVVESFSLSERTQELSPRAPRALER